MKRDGEVWHSEVQRSMGGVWCDEIRDGFVLYGIRLCAGCYKRLLITPSYEMCARR